MADDMIPLCVPALRGNELEYLRQCVETNWVSYVGSFVSRFEAQTADFVGAPHAVATQQYPPDDLVGRNYYQPTANGAERDIATRLERLRKIIRGQ